MTEYRIIRPGDVDLVFEGQLLADETTREAGKAHWADLRIYKTNSGKYIVEWIGRTSVPGQIDKPQVTVADNADGVRTALYRYGPGDRRYITKVALDALEAAGAKDQAIRAAAVERI